MYGDFELLNIIATTPPKTEISKNNKKASSYHFVTHRYLNDYNNYGRM